MKPLPRFLIAVALATLVLSVPVAPAAAATTTFADEFNAGPLNTGVWQVALPWGTQWNNRELQWYDPANISFVNGGMRFTTEKRTVNGYPYASGLVTSRTRYGYGYYEVRAKLPKTQGVWPAIWLLADGSHELDIMELLGNTPNKMYMTYHRGGSQVYQATYTLPSGDFSQAYHTFAADWQPGYIRWYVDGVKRGEYTGTVNSTAQNIILNTAVGDSTSWPGAPNSTTVMPQYMDIDYVRVYPTMPAPTPTNQAPAAGADAFSTNEDAALSIAAPGVLGNDTDADGNALTASVVGRPAHGTVALSGNGSFIYTPQAGYSGSDSFTYQASDGAALSAVTPVNITVRAVNDAPVASADSFSVDQDSVLRIAAPGILGNDSDPEGDALSAGVASQPAHGMVSIAADGSFVYTPQAGWYGTDGFTYRATDGNLQSAPAAVSVTVNHVNHAPAATAKSFSLDQDTALTVAVPGVLAGATDPDGDPLTATLAGQPAHGTVYLSADGSFVYTPEAGWFGTDTFSFRVTDGSALSAPTAVTIAVDEVVPPVIDPDPGTEPTTPPVIDPDPGTEPTTPPVTDPGTEPTTPPAVSDTAPVAAPDSYRIAQDTTLSVSAPGILGNDSDADGDALTAVAVAQPAHGSLLLSPDGSLTYVPDRGWYGTDSFSYRASDGTMSSAPSVVTVKVDRLRARGRWHHRLRTATMSSGAWYAGSRRQTDVGVRTWRAARTSWQRVCGYAARFFQ